MSQQCWGRLPRGTEESGEIKCPQALLSPGRISAGLGPFLSPLPVHVTQVSTLWGLRE